MNIYRIKDFYHSCLMKVVSKFREINITVRLKIGFILITVIPVLAVGYFAYYQGSDTIYNKMSRSITQTVDQVGINLDYQLQAIRNDGTEIAYSNLVQQALENYDKIDKGDLNNVQSQLSDYINKKYIFSKRVSEITIYTLNMERINAYGPSDFRFIPKKDNLPKMLQRIDNNDGLYLWEAFGPDFEEGLATKVYGERNSIILGRIIKSLKNGNKIGYILMRIEESVLSDIYKNIDIGTDTQMFILNSKNIVISSNTKYASVGREYEDKELHQTIKQSGEQRIFNYKLDGNSYLAVFTPAQNADWSILALVRLSYLYSDSRQLLSNIFFIGLLCLIFAICISAIMLESIVNPIKKLVKGMNRFTNGKFDIKIEEMGRDELTELTICFNNMIVEIKSLINNIKANEMQKRELEIRALQAQINPHFLANTLNTVSYMASLKKERNIEDIINSIVTLLNGCMKNDTDLITVEEEILFLRSYITTQEYRLFGRIKVEFDIEPSIYPCKIPRFLLQPVLENSIIHGIEPSGKTGLIVVKGFEDNSRLVFSITDNGIGMDREQIEALLKSEKRSERGRLNGIGVANVIERINLLFGSQYGITVNSVPGVFTTVNITLPVITPQFKENFPVVG